LLMALSMGAQLFTVPGQEIELITALLEDATTPAQRLAQLALFEI
jgi:hypothetical protein